MEDKFSTNSAMNVHRLRNKILPHHHQDGLKKHNKVISVNKDMEKLELYAITTVVIISLGI